MPWTYEQATGNLISPLGIKVATGYAGGNCGNNPEGVNNPDAQDQDSPKLGPFALVLEPDPANEMFGRGDFRMHGDSITHPGCASEGCVIMPRNIRENVWASNDHVINVVAGSV